MAGAASVIPTLKDELDRKVFETIEYLVSAVHKGRMTKAQVSASLDTLFMAVSGLVDNNFINIITEAQKVVADDQSVVKRHFALQGSNIVHTISWVPGTTKIIACRRERGLATGGTVKEYDSVEIASKAFRVFGETIERKGWVEL